MLGGHSFAFRFALLVFQPLDQLRQVSDFACDRSDEGLLLADGALQFAHLQQHIAQFALHRERALAALFAAGDGHVMEALARSREEERIRIFQRERASDFGIGHDVPVAQLGQNHFQRLAKAVEYANAVLEGNNRIGVRDVMHRLVEVKRELRLRIFGMNQECRPAIDIGPQQPQTFVRRIPRLHHDVVQLIAQKVVDHVLVTIFNLEKVCQHACGRASHLAALPK